MIMVKTDKKLNDGDDSGRPTTVSAVHLSRSLGLPGGATRPFGKPILIFQAGDARLSGAADAGQ
jgi:hypothetical protein